MLFDHGSDSLVCVMLAGNLTCMLAMGNSFWGIVYVFIGCSPFYFSTLESYYLGGVYLPVVNGVSDGSVVYCLLAITLSFFEHEDLIKGVVFGLRPGHLFAISTGIGSVMICAGK